MKPIVAFLSLSLMAFCAYSLAEEAQDPTSSAVTEQSKAIESSVTKKKETIHSMKTCVNEEGKTLKKGDQGYKNCMRRHEQMGGISGENYPYGDQPAQNPVQNPESKPMDGATQ